MPDKPQPPLPGKKPDGYFSGFAAGSAAMLSLSRIWEDSQVKAYLDRRERRVKYALIALAALVPLLLLYAALRPEAPTGPAKEERSRGPIKFSMPAFLDVSRPATPDAEKPGALPKSGRNALVYLFHMTGRTAPCLQLEEYARETVRREFAGKYKDWNIWFSPVNLEEGENYKLADRYSLTQKEILVQKFDGDAPRAWRKLDRAWDLLGSSAALSAYLTGETKKFLDEGGEAGLSVSTVPGILLPPGADRAAQEAAAALPGFEVATAPVLSGILPPAGPATGTAAASTAAAAGGPAH